MSDDYRLIIHAGAPKCGSSSLQSTLSRQPRFAARDGRRYAYCSILDGGDVVHGAALSRRAAASPFGYSSSANIVDADWTASVDSVSQTLQDIRAEHGTPILSSEGWVSRAEAFATSGLIEKAGGRAHVVIFVRPPVDWLNSAWWQWGAWTGRPLRRYVEVNLGSVRWHAHAKAWARVPGVERVTLRLAERNVVPVFYDMLDAAPPAPVMSNSGVPPAFLAFMKRNRRYREGPHTPQVEFVVARHLDCGGVRAPWVLSAEEIALVFARTPQLPKGVRARLHPEDRDAMTREARWWDAGAYAGHAVESDERWSTESALVELHDALLKPVGPVGRWHLRGSAHRLRKAARLGRIADADAEIARVVDWVVAHDKARRLQQAVERAGARTRG